MGCATGEMSSFLEKTHQVTAVDASRRMIRVAKNHHKNIDFKLANVYKLPFEDESFDTVVSASLINIVTDKKKAIREILRVCKIGGAITLLFPLKGFKNSDHQRLEQQLNLKRFSKTALKMWHSMADKMSLEELGESFENQGGYQIVNSTIYLDGMVVSVSIHKIGRTL